MIVLKRGKTQPITIVILIVIAFIIIVAVRARFFSNEKTSGQSITPAKTQMASNSDVNRGGDALVRNKELQQRAEQAEKLIESMKENGVDFSRKTVFVEGKSDECVYQRTLKLFFPKNCQNILIKSPENGSAQAATDYLNSWRLRQRHKKLPHTKAVALLDNDEAAHDARHKSLPENIGPEIKVFYVSPKRTTLQMYSKEFQPKKDLESLYPDFFWTLAKNKGWLEKVGNEKVFDKLPPAIQKKIKSGQKTDRFYGLSENEKLRLEYQFSFKGKRKASEYIATCDDEEAKIILKDVESNLQEVVAWLNA